MFPSVIGMVVSCSGPVTHSPADLSIGSAGSSQLSSPWDLPMTEGSCCTHGHDWSVQGTKAFYLNEGTNGGTKWVRLYRSVQREPHFLRGVGKGSKPALLLSKLYFFRAVLG